MNTKALRALKLKLYPLWVFRPERLWLLSISLRDRGHWVLAFFIKQLNTFVYHNSLSPACTVSPDVSLNHYGIGVVVDAKVTIGRRVQINQNVTFSVRGQLDDPKEIVVEDDVMIGANSVIITPRDKSLRIGRGARIGAGTVITQDVPPGATVVSQPPRVIPRTDVNGGTPDGD